MTSAPPSDSLEVSRIVSATPERVFDACTQADELPEWWGPAGVTCIAAEIDLRVGGAYRIGNRLPDGSVLWISGEFVTIERPNLLVYTWTLNGQDHNPELVRVAFKCHEHGTSVVIKHSRVRTATLREQHEEGWVGCLEGIATHLDAHLQA